MLDTIYCCRFCQRGRQAATVFCITGIGGGSRPLSKREQERPLLSERLSPRSAAIPLPVVPPRRRRVLFRSSRFLPVTTMVLTCQGDLPPNVRPERHCGRRHRLKEA